MDVMQFAGHVSNIAGTGERPSVIGPDKRGQVRLWLSNGWGVLLTGDDGKHREATAVRFTVPFLPGWQTEPEWIPAAAPLASGKRPGLPSRWTDMAPGDVANVLVELDRLARVAPLPAAGAEGSGDNFLCPLCGKLAVRDLSTLDYRNDRQSTECENCGKKIHRYPGDLGSARAWRPGA
jgi:predicted RNA-binding Zn-ribbon protein involved in translation (DUF1610 family)